jgi:hypothetical protein
MKDLKKIMNLFYRVEHFEEKNEKLQKDPIKNFI